MKNMKVSMKLLVSFLIVTVMAIVLAGVGIFSSVTISNNYTYLLENPVDREESLRQMELQFTMMRYRSANFAMETGNPDTITDTLTPQYEEAYATFNSELDAYIESNNNDPRRDEATKQEYTKIADNLRSLVTQFYETGYQTRELALAEDLPAATTSLRDAIPLANEIIGIIDEDLITVADATVVRETESSDVMSTTFMFVQIGVTVVAIIVSIFMAIYISRMISRPLVVLAAFMKRAGSTGDIKLTQYDHDVIGKYAPVKDETGQLVASTAEFVTSVIDISDNLQTISQGDLTVDVKLKSDKDTIGLSLQRMLQNLNNMFGEINNSTAQVSTGAKQIADGAQALAQGSTEQAASIQQLSSSIATIADKTRTNAEMAENAAKLAGNIKRSAETGSQQMSEMMSAASEINAASQSIGKVIKTIDDIAFQTNILALNAAVEAARAGQHGKGFAVVAEEVRNLAAKSAEAAKDTESLIANSIEKAELGERIAGDTAASLSEIVAGINESTTLVAEIARSSEEQSLGISQINIGIDQVAQVVQQNSATAEESAAASEEMSGQSDMLEELIAQFKLKNGKNRKFVTDATSRTEALPSGPVDIDPGAFGKY